MDGGGGVRWLAADILAYFVCQVLKLNVIFPDAKDEK